MMVTRMRFISPKAAGAFLALAALSMLAAGCGLQYVDPGQNPAQVTITLKALVTPAQMEKTKVDNLLTRPFVLPGAFHEILGPYYDWNLYEIEKDGYLRPLKPAGEVKTRYIEGSRMEMTATFLAPVGPKELRVLVESYFIHRYVEAFTEYDQPVEIATFRKDFKLGLCPGCRLKVSAEFSK